MSSGAPDPEPLLGQAKSRQALLSGLASLCETLLRESELSSELARVKKWWGIVIGNSRCSSAPNHLVGHTIKAQCVLRSTSNLMPHGTAKKRSRPRATHSQPSKSSRRQILHFHLFFLNRDISRPPSNAIIPAAPRGRPPRPIPRRDQV